MRIVDTVVYARIFCSCSLVLCLSASVARLTRHWHGPMGGGAVGQTRMVLDPVVFVIVQWVMCKGEDTEREVCKESTVEMMAD